MTILNSCQRYLLRGAIELRIMLIDGLNEGLGRGDRHDI
jgi:hypothetical protein